MTIHVLADVQIGDLQQFLDVFGSEGLEKRKEHGCQAATVFTKPDQDGQITVLLEFPDQASFDQFRSDEAAPPIMRKGGAQGPPEFTILAQVATFQH